MKRKKNKSPQQLYQAARGNLLLMLIFSAFNVAFAAFGVDIYFLFSDYLAYMLALTGRVFLEHTDEGLYLAVGTRLCGARAGAVSAVLDLLEEAARLDDRGARAVRGGYRRARGRYARIGRRSL